MSGVKFTFDPPQRAKVFKGKRWIDGTPCWVTMFRYPKSGSWFKGGTYDTWQEAMDALDNYRRSMR